MVYLFISIPFRRSSTDRSEPKVIRPQARIRPGLSVAFPKATRGPLESSGAAYDSVPSSLMCRTDDQWPYSKDPSLRSG